MKAWFFPTTRGEGYSQLCKKCIIFLTIFAAIVLGFCFSDGGDEYAKIQHKRLDLANPGICGVRICYWTPHKVEVGILLLITCLSSLQLYGSGKNTSSFSAWVLTEVKWAAFTRTNVCIISVQGRGSEFLLFISFVLGSKPKYELQFSKLRMEYHFFFLQASAPHWWE